MPGPLAHLRILELSGLVAGSYCSRLLGGLGAEVIKIEQPGRGDPLRRIGPFIQDRPDVDGSALFAYLNAGKHSVTLDLASPTGLKLFHDLLPSVDIIVESVNPRLKRDLQISYDTWRRIKPELIIIGITPFGQTGPNSDRDATELTALAESGYLYLCGDPEKEPLKPYGYQGHYFAGLQAAMAALAAVTRRRITGKGSVIDLSLQEAIAFLMMGNLTWHHYFGESYHRAGSRVAPGLRRGTYSGNLLPCKDGYVFVSAGQNQEMLAFLVEEPRLESKELWREAARHAEEIDRACINWLQHHNREEIANQAQELRVCITPMWSLPEAVAQPQLQAREAFHPANTSTGSFLTPARLPFRMSSIKLPEDLSPPELGQDNSRIFRDLLGLEGDDLVRLRYFGII